LKLLAIVGSPRPRGNTNYLVDQALIKAEELGIETEKISLSKYKETRAWDTMTALPAIPAQ